MTEKHVSSSNNASLTLSVTLSAQAENSVILIRDEGMGMSHNAIERCMDPFFTTKKAGTGLGLTLSRQYTQDNNGRLEIESQPGIYTQIRITFRRECV